MTNRDFKFENGEKVKDIITGFMGIVTGSVYYITGCNQYLITPKVKVDNASVESSWYDEDRLELVVVRKDKIKNSINGPGKMAPIK